MNDGAGVNVMRVWIYPEKTYGDLGAERWVCEWYELKPSAEGRDNIDPDSDLICKATAHKTKAAALKKARTVAKNPAYYYGASVVLQRVDWFVEEDRIAEWVNVGDAEYI